MYTASIARNATDQTIAKLLVVEPNCRENTKQDEGDQNDKVR